MEINIQTPNNTINDRSTSLNRVVQEYNFWKYETKMIVVSGICFIISAGCITILILDRSNCALNNGIFSVLGGIVGLMTGLFSSKSGQCVSSRRSSQEDV